MKEVIHKPQLKQETQLMLEKVISPFVHFNNIATMLRLNSV